MKRRLGSLLLMLALLLPLLQGCWDRHELNEVSIVTGMALDRGKSHRFKLTIEALNSSELAGKRSTGNAPVVVYSEEGDSVSELSNRMNVGMSRMLIFSHMRVLAIADSIAKEGLIDFLDYMERNREIRDDFNVLIVEGATAAEAVSTTYPLQKVPSMKVHAQIESFYREWGGDPRVRLKDLIASLTSPGRQPVAETVRIEGKHGAGNNVENNKVLVPDAVVAVSGMAVFREDKMVGKMPLQDVQNYVITQNLLQNAAFAIPCGKGAFFDVKVNNSKTSVKAMYQKDVPHIEITITLEGYLDGLECPLELDKVETFEKIEQQMNKTLAQRIKTTIKTVQDDYGVDIFGFGEDMYRQDTDAYKKVRNRWDKEFQKAKVDVIVNTKVRRTGIRTKSILTDVQK